MNNYYNSLLPFFFFSFASLPAFLLQQKSLLVTRCSISNFRLQTAWGRCHVSYALCKLGSKHCITWTTTTTWGWIVPLSHMQRQPSLLILPCSPVLEKRDMSAGSSVLPYNNETLLEITKELAVGDRKSVV